MKKFYQSLKISCLGLLLVGQILNAQYDNGVLIANEGNFGTPNADVSYIDQDNLQITNNIYQTVNNEPLGDVLQNIGIHGDKAYLVLNNSNKIVVVDRASFEQLAVVTDQINLPRYITFANDKFYVSNSSTTSVGVFNISDNSFVTLIEGFSVVEMMATAGSHVFVMNGSFGTGNAVSAIDPTTDTVVQSIEVGDGINGIVSDGTYLYTISKTPSASINKINGETLEIEATLDMPSITGARHIQFKDGMLYFTGNGVNIYQVNADLSSDATLLSSVADNSWSTFYGFGVFDNYVLSSDANGFTAASIIKVFNKTNGAEVATYSAGIGSNGFYANVSSDMSVEDVSIAQNQVQIYPNPAHDEFYIKGVDQAQVDIYSTLGKLVKSAQFNGDAISVKGMPKGVYFVVISNENMKVNKKVILK